MNYTTAINKFTADITHKDWSALNFGEITDAINSPLFAQTAKFEEKIQGLRVGAISQDLNTLLEFVAPSANVRVTTDKAFSYLKVDGKKDFAENNLDEVERGRSGEYGYIGYEEQKAVGILKDYGLSTIVEKDDIENNPAFVQEQMNRLANKITGAKVLKAVSLLESMATADELAKTGDILNAMADGIASTQDACGYAPNRLLIGRGFWLRLRKLMVAGNNAYNFQAPKTLAELGDYLGVEVYMPEAHYKNGATFPVIANAEAILFTGESGISKDDLTNLKSFTDKGMQFYNAEHNQGRMNIITAHESSALEKTSLLGVRKFTIAS